jgi:hypothetical protein
MSDRRHAIAPVAILLVDAVNAAGERGLDWKQVSAVLDEARGELGLPIPKSRSVRCRTAYRWMDALEQSGRYEQVGDMRPGTPPGKTRKRIRRIRAGQEAA